MEVAASQLSKNEVVKKWKENKKDLKLSTLQKATTKSYFKIMSENFSLSLSLPLWLTHTHTHARTHTHTRTLSPNRSTLWHSRWLLKLGNLHQSKNQEEEPKIDFWIKASFLKGEKIIDLFFLHVNKKMKNQVCAKLMTRNKTPQEQMCYRLVPINKIHIFCSTQLWMSPLTAFVKSFA